MTRRWRRRVPCASVQRASGFPGLASMRILVVEDDELIARGIVSGLRAFGITADRVESVAHAELARQTTHCDAMVLDLGLPDERSEEHTSELQSLMRISYAVFCLKKKKKTKTSKTKSQRQLYRR